MELEWTELENARKKRDEAKPPEFAAVLGESGFGDLFGFGALQSEPQAEWSGLSGSATRDRA